jgi:hypothetical protein
VARERYANIVTAMPVSEERLRVLAQTVSDRLCGEPVTCGSLGLFKSIGGSIEAPPELQILINDQVPKTELTDPPLTAELFTRPDLLLDVLREGVGNEALHRIIDRTHATLVDASDPVKYSRQLSKSAADLRKIGLTPIAIVHSASIPDWMLKARLSDEPQEAGLPVESTVEVRSDEPIEGYYFHLDGVPLYRMMLPVPPGESFVVANENFDTVWLGRYESGAVVRVHWQVNPQDTTTGALVLRFSLKDRPLIGPLTRMLHAPDGVAVPPSEAPSKRT